MYFSSNLQYLRRHSGITQERLAQQLCVSRQAISKWESGESIPEIPTLLQLAELFSCKLDDLLQQDLTVPVFPVRLVTVKGFRMVRYRMISPNAFDDVQVYLENWAKQQHLSEPSILLWHFPYITEEQKRRFSLDGFEAVCLLPEDFSPAGCTLSVESQPDCTYALLTLTEPNGRSSSQVADGIRTILDTLQRLGIRKTASEQCLPCFERHYTKEGVSYADLFLQCQGAPHTESIRLTER